MSDSEFQDGRTWEALSALAHHRLDTVRVVVDVNRAQCDGPMDTVMSIEPLAERVRAFGASVDHVDGHDLTALREAMQRETGQPHVVLAYTDPVRGLPELQAREPVLHYLRFTGPDEKAGYETAYRRLRAEVN